MNNQQTNKTSNTSNSQTEKSTNNEHKKNIAYMSQI